MPTWDVSPVEPDNKNVRPRLGHSALEEDMPVGSRIVFRSECQRSVIDVDSDDEQPLVPFCPPTDVVEGLERDLREGLLDQFPEGCYSRLAVSLGHSHGENPSESHVLASVVGVPGSSGVDYGRVAEVVERQVLRPPQCQRADWTHHHISRCRVTSMLEQVRAWRIFLLNVRVHLQINLTSRGQHNGG